MTCTYENIFMKRPPDKFLLLMLITLLISVSCRSNRSETTKLSVNDKVPPTFQVEGAGYELFFSVYEITSERDKNGMNNRPMWIFKSKQRGEHETWIPITYGQLADEFEQTFPTTGPPAQLVEDKLYGAHTTIYSTAGDEVLFMIKDGKTNLVGNRK